MTVNLGEYMEVEVDLLNAALVEAEKAIVRRFSWVYGTAIDSEGGSFRLVLTKVNGKMGLYVGDAFTPIAHASLEMRMVVASMLPALVAKLENELAKLPNRVHNAIESARNAATLVEIAQVTP